MRIILSSYVDLEVRHLSSLVVNKAIQELNISSNNYLIIHRNESGIIDNISYDMNGINNIKVELAEIIQNNFYMIESGNYMGYDMAQQEKLRKKYKYIHNGYICDITLNSLHNSTLFANVGISVPIKLSFIGNTNVEIKVDAIEYGINNVLVKVYAVVDITNYISMPISSSEYHLIVEEPISVEIIQGNIPDYYYNSLR